MINHMVIGASWVSAMLAIIAGSSAAAQEHGRAQTGVAAVYSYPGGRTASGEKLDSGKLTAAHRTLPFGTVVRVTNLRNRKSVQVRINDRGPFTKGRIIDLSPAAARQLGFTGLAKVEVQVSAAAGVAAAR